MSTEESSHNWISEATKSESEPSSQSSDGDKDVFMSCNEEAEQWLTKGAKRHVQGALKAVADGMSKSDAERRRRQEKQYSAIEKPLKAASNIRRPGPWRVL